MKNIYFCLPIIFLLSCNTNVQHNNAPTINTLAVNYVKLGLDIGRYDAAFIDAYYGPDSLQPTAPIKDIFPKDSLLNEVSKIQTALTELLKTEKDDTIITRAKWMHAQLTAYGRRIKIYSGEYASFDEESKELFDAVAPIFPESHYQDLVKQLDNVLPGTGSIPERFQTLANKFIIPKDKLDTVFKASIAECRKRTLAHYTLPDNEKFTLEFVNNKSWSGYNWYKGNYESLIQINTDMQIFIDRAIDVGSHESYPGHHVYNMLMEQHLYHEKGWVEISLYPLFSPQSLIAEGTANYGIDVVFPGYEKVQYCKDVLLPLAGIDTTGISNYFTALEVRGALNFARNEVGRGIINHTMDSTEAMRWLKDYGLMNDETAIKSMHFINDYRTYIINYNYGLELVKNYVEAKGGTADNPEKRWLAFAWLLSNPVLPSNLISTAK
ncbi:MAG: hypothetical protein KBF51_13385 [Chitinophagales bacterium]|nr:hypothetical protein [Chitinophagales bacterium]